MRVAELRAACAARGLDDRGRKSNLVSRLEDAEEAVACLEPANGSTAALEHHDTNAYRTLAPTHTQTALDERAASSFSSSSSSSKSRERTRVLSPNEHGIDPGSIPRYVRTLQRRLARGDANAFADGAVNKKHRLFVVGGAARDLFLGKTPRDFDLLTDASWSAIKRRARPCVVVGRRFKVAHCFEEKSDAPGKRTGAFFELVSMRGEEEEEEAFRSRDGKIFEAEKRRDDPREPVSAEVTYDDTTIDDESALDPDVARRLRADASRRDFTVNALAYDVESGYLYDFVGAIEDIRSRTVRTVHPSAVLSFREDPARMLRAVRVAARHDFVLAGAVTSALKASAHLLRTEHTARLAGELKALLTRGFSAKAVALLWTTGALEHVAHLHATHVARAVDPATNFVAAPPGAFHIFTETQTATEAGEDTTSHSPRSEDADASVGGALSNDPRTKHALPADLPWLVHDIDRTGSALTRHRRGGKRVSDATLRRVVREDPLFKILRALDRRVARTGDGGACSETLAMACLAAPFAVKKLGWPFLEPEETCNPRPVRPTRHKTSLQADRESGESGESGESASGSPVRRFAGARFAARLAAFAASRSEGERLAWRAAAEKRADTRVVMTHKKTALKSASKSASRAPSESLPDRGGSRWERAFAAWTEEAGYAARVMQADYHLSAKHVMASALVTMHAPFLRAAPALDVLRRRAELAASSKARPGKEVDFSATAKSATFSFASQKTFSKKKRRRRDEDASVTADEGLTRVLRLLAGGGDTASQTASRRASRRYGAKAKAKAAAAPGGGVGGVGGVVVAALPGELLAFAEILCDAALEGTAVTLDDADDLLVGKNDEEDETDAERYEVGDEDFDPDEPL